jgi:hypothetical protein
MRHAEFLIRPLMEGFDFGRRQTKLQRPERFLHRLRDRGAVVKPPRLGDFLNFLLLRPGVFPAGFFRLKRGDVF